MEKIEQQNWWTAEQAAMFIEELRIVQTQILIVWWEVPN